MFVARGDHFFFLHWTFRRVRNFFRYCRVVEDQGEIQEGLFRNFRLLIILRERNLG